MKEQIQETIAISCFFGIPILIAIFLLYQSIQEKQRNIVLHKQYLAGQHKLRKIYSEKTSATNGHLVCNFFIQVL